MTCRKVILFMMIVLGILVPAQVGTFAAETAANSASEVTAANGARAAQTYKEALDIVRTIPVKDGDRGQLFALLATALTRVQPGPDTNAAIAEALVEVRGMSISSARPKFVKALSLAQLAIAQFRAGDSVGARSSLAEANQLATDLGWNVWEKTQTLIRIASALSAIGDPDAARSTLRQASESSTANPVAAQRTAQQYLIAKEQAILGDIAGAEETIGRVNTLAVNSMQMDDVDAANGLALLAIAEAKFKIGDTAGGLTALSDAKNPIRNSRPSILADIAVLQLKAGDRAAAEATMKFAFDYIRPWRTDVLRAIILAHLAKGQVALGDLEGARQTIRDASAGAHEVTDPYKRALALKDIVAAQLLIGDTQAAVTTLAEELGIARSISAAAARADALEGAARGYFKLSDTKQAHEIAAEAITAALSISAKAGRMQMLSRIAVAQAEIGDLEAALGNARTLDPASLRAKTLYTIAATISGLTDEANPAGPPAPPAG